MAGLAFLLTLIVIVPFCCAVQYVDPSDADVLLDICHSNKPSSWDDCQKYTRTTFPCNTSQQSAIGVYCFPPSVSNNVAEVRLISNGLTGTLPSSLGQLSQVLRLIVNNNYLMSPSGTIPSSLGQLSQVLEIDLSSNKLSGTIPAVLGQLEQLHYLWLEGNKLTGGIPSSLGKLSQLEFLMLDHNQLSGPIPESIGNLSQLSVLLLDNNVALSGKLNVPSHVFNNTDFCSIENTKACYVKRTDGRICGGTVC